ncbi:putative HTH-type transcriptional regulator [uncultured archaeon]|nr:putative HTH-type transcriptional regulator [uncultured archaeon]
MANSFDLDDVDRAILRHLRQSSRMSLQEMSRRTGVSDATLQFRLKRLKAKRAIERFTIIASPKATGYAVTAIILVQTDAEKHDQAMKALAAIPEVTEVYGVLGEYDLFVKVWSRSLEELNALINDSIRSIEGIEDLIEIVVVKRAKEETAPV